MKLAEILDKPLPFEVTENSGSAFHAEFKAGDRLIRFYATDEAAEFDVDAGNWVIEFAEVKTNTQFQYGTNDYGATGSGKEFNVFSTLKAILEKFIKEKKPLQIEFDADKTEGSRVNVYTRLVKKNLPKGYRLDVDHKDSKLYAKFKIIKEALDKPTSFKIVRQTPKFFMANFMSNGREIGFSAQVFAHPDKWEISFEELTEKDGMMRSTTKKTGGGKEFEVFATVKSIIAEFIKLYDPEKMLIDSSKAEPNRAKLYQRMISKNLPAGWKVDRDESHPTYTTFMLIKEGTVT